MAKILLLTHEFPPFQGGIGTYACQLASAASELGHRVEVFAPNYGRDRAFEDRMLYPFRVVRFRGGRYSERGLPGVLFRIGRLLGKERYDIVHAVDWPHLLGLGLLNKVRRLPFVTTTYGTEVLGSARSRYARAIGGGRVFERADRVLAISEFTKELLLGTFPQIDPKRVPITPLGVAPFWFGDPAEAARTRTEFGIPADRRVILTASRIDPRKGHRVALRALRLLPAEVKAGICYVVVGRGDDGDYLAELRALADESRVPVVFTGGVPDESLRGLYGLASLFCLPGEPHPKKVEGFGLVFLEAAAQGLPAIASNVGAVAEVVRHGETGRIVAPMDPEALASEIALLLGDDGLREGLGRAARAWAKGFTWERCAELTYGAVGTAVAGPPRAEALELAR